MKHSSRQTFVVSRIPPQHYLRIPLSKIKSFVKEKLSDTFINIPLEFQFA